MSVDFAQISSSKQFSSALSSVYRSQQQRQSPALGYEDQVSTHFNPLLLISLVAEKCQKLPLVANNNNNTGKSEYFDQFLNVNEENPFLSPVFMPSSPSQTSSHSSSHPQQQIVQTFPLDYSQSSSTLKRSHAHAFSHQIVHPSSSHGSEDLGADASSSIHRGGTPAKRGRPSLSSANRQRHSRLSFQPGYVDIVYPSVRFTKLPDHYRSKKALPYPFGLKCNFDEKPIVDDTKVSITAGNNSHPSTQLINNTSKMSSNSAEFRDFRFVGKSGRGKTLLMTVTIWTTPPIVVTYRNAIKITADGPRPGRANKSSSMQQTTSTPQSRSSNPGVNSSTSSTASTSSSRHRSVFEEPNLANVQMDTISTTSLPLFHQQLPPLTRASLRPSVLQFAGGQSSGTRSAPVMEPITPPEKTAAGLKPCAIEEEEIDVGTYTPVQDQPKQIPIVSSSSNTPEEEGDTITDDHTDVKKTTEKLTKASDELKPHACMQTPSSTSFISPDAKISPRARSKSLDSALWRPWSQ